jgi:hypothetical protein
LLAGGGCRGGASPEDMRSRAPVAGLERDQAEEIEKRTGNPFGERRGSQIGRGGRAAASRGSGASASSRGCGETRPRKERRGLASLPHQGKLTVLRQLQGAATRRRGDGPWLGGGGTARVSGVRPLQGAKDPNN